MRNRPSGHLRREGDEQEDTTYERGVEGVLSQTAESHLTYTDRYHCTDQYDPPIETGREVEGEQQTREDCREVADGLSLLFEQETADAPFGEPTSANRDSGRDESTYTKLDH